MSRVHECVCRVSIFPGCALRACEELLLWSREFVGLGHLSTELVCVCGHTRSERHVFDVAVSVDYNNKTGAV